MSKCGLTPARIAVVFCLLLAVGCVISPRRTLGGGGGTPTPTPTLTPTPTPNPAAAGKLYVMNTTTNSLLRFDNAFTANGNATPAATIFGTSTTFNSPNFITLDAANDRLYIADTSDLSIVIYDTISTKNGNVAPNRTIAGSATTLIAPTDVAFDRVRNQLYVLDDPKILVFGSTSLATGGNVSPTRSLSTAFIAGASAIFLDAANDRLFAADLDGAIAIYDNASTLPTGAINPSRTIQGASTQLGNPDGIQLDGQGRLIVSNAGNTAAAIPSSITIYSSAAIASGGNVAPVAQIAGSNTGMSVPNQIVVDPFGTGTVYNADPGAARIAVFANLSTATGNIAPTRKISGSSTGMTASGPVGVALDNTR